MMQPPPDLTDRVALERFRARACRMHDPALFLHEAVADEIQERLKEVNRGFTAPAIISAFPEIWQNRIPDATFAKDGDILLLEEGAHDLVIHFMCLHWSNDPVGQLVQCRRTLKPDGLFIAALFGGQTLAELRIALAQAEIALTGGLSPRIVPMGEIRDLGGLLQRAGFALPVADSWPQTVSYRDMFHLIGDLRAMGEINALAARRRTIPARRLFDQANAGYQETFGTANGRIPATFDTIFLTGWAPDESQQKPLRPGSASARLADALGTNETPLEDHVPRPGN